MVAVYHKWRAIDRVEEHMGTYNNAWEPMRTERPKAEACLSENCSASGKNCRGTARTVVRSEGLTSILGSSDYQFVNTRLSISQHQNYKSRRIGFNKMLKMDQTPFDSLYNAIDLLGSAWVAIL